MPTGAAASAVDAADFLDLADPAVVADPYPHLAALRAVAPVAWHSGLSLWLATGHAEASGAVLRDRRLGRVFAAADPGARLGDVQLAARRLHPRQRAAQAHAAAPARRGRVRPRARRSGSRRGSSSWQAPCSTRPAPDGSTEPFDVLAGYAEPLPVLVIAELLGVPESDRHHLRPWSQAIVRMYEVDRTPERGGAGAHGQCRVRRLRRGAGRRPGAPAPARTC